MYQLLRLFNIYYKDVYIKLNSETDSRMPAIQMSQNNFIRPNRLEHLA